MTLKPTESELEIMQILWQCGPLTVRQVNDKLNEHRKVGYTTTLKIMQIMVEKGQLSRDTTHRSHVYTPALPPEKVKSNILDHVLNTVFNGNRSSLVLQALGSQRVTGKELEEIKKAIEELENKSDGTV
jgi:predicted transcriptional regulator